MLHKIITALLCLACVACMYVGYQGAWELTHIDYVCAKECSAVFPAGQSKMVAGKCVCFEVQQLPLKNDTQEAI